MLTCDQGLSFTRINITYIFQKEPREPIKVFAADSHHAGFCMLAIAAGGGKSLKICDKGDMGSINITDVRNILLAAEIKSKQIQGDHNIIYK